MDREAADHGQRLPVARPGPPQHADEAESAHGCSAENGARTRRWSNALRLVLVAVAVAVAVAAAWGTADAQRTGRATPAQVIGRLSADQLAGQRVVYAYAGLRPPASVLATIRRGQAGGVILFANNIASVQQARQVVAALQRASLSSPLHARLLILTDQEGGEVRRLPGGPSLSEKQIGASANPTGLAASAGAVAARALTSAGVSANLAPVLDVYRTRGNFIDQAGRSYSSHASVVAAAGAAFITAQQGLGSSASAKHFPGLGAATRAQNTDLRPVTLNVPLATVRSVDEAPYRQAIAAGVRLVMTSWAVIRRLTRVGLPVSLRPSSGASSAGAWASAA